MIFTKNIKVAVRCTDGELIFEFRRPTNKEKNTYSAEVLKMDTKEELAFLEKQDAVRVSMFDTFIEQVYTEKKTTTDGIVTILRETVTDEAGKLMEPRDFPEDVKVKAASRAFEFNTFQAKNF